MSDPPLSVNLPTPPPSSSSITLKPPPSPPIRLLPALLPGGGGLVSISPRKRERTNYPLGPFTLKRSKSSHESNKTDTLSTNPAHELAEENRAEDLGERDYDVVLSYVEYLEHMQSGAISFFKLERDMYVVQGWDGRRKVAKVWMPDLPLNDVMDSLYGNRTNGIIYTMLEWGMKQQWSVFVLWSIWYRIAFTPVFWRNLGRRNLGGLIMILMNVSQ